MTPLIAALDRNDFANYVSAVFTVFYLLIFVRIVVSWVVSYRGSLPYNTPLRAVTGFVEETVDPYLGLFRRLLPPVGGRFALDLSPVIGIIVLLIVDAIVVGLIRG